MNYRDLVYILLAIVASPMLLRKKREGWAQRLGRIEPLPPKKSGSPGRLMLHAVSVGEVSALRSIVPMLLEQSLDLLITASTDTGLKRAHELFASTCHVRRYPLDASWAVRRFLDAARPDAVALVELEVWPNFVQACSARDIPVCIINGRLSARSFRGYRKIRPFLRPTFSRLAFAAVQDFEYQERFVHMGVPPDRCIVAGSMKWDNAKIERDVPGAQALALELGIDRSKPLIVAGSTGPTRDGGEEALLHRACPPGAQLLCAPRKPERFEEAAAALPGCVRRSSTKASPPATPPPAKTDRFLLDTIGELRQAYSLADVVVVGRSFGDLYGSDPLEPVGLGKPTVIGPAVADFSSIVAELERNQGIKRSTPSSLASDLLQVLENKDVAAKMVVSGLACITNNQGATARQAKMLMELVRRSQSSPPTP
jgi:3-deoxy-D-manno-octulosonic-acid transferase